MDYTFYLAISSGTFPGVWKVAKITHISKNLITSQQLTAIAILTTCSKGFETSYQGIFSHVAPITSPHWFYAKEIHQVKHDS